MEKHSAISRGQELTLAIESLAFGGKGVARLDGYVVFVDGALPGQQVSARITRRRKDYAEARVVQILEQSKKAVEPRCPHFGECGGCRLQHLSYESQLEFKKVQVEDCLRRIGGIEETLVLETTPSPDQYYYRNKMEFSFGAQRWLSSGELKVAEISKPKDFALGLHVRGRFDKILDLDTCYLQSPASVEVLNDVRQAVLDSAIPAYSTKDHSGFWRHLVIREGKQTGETMVNVVTSGRPQHYGIVDDLSQRLKESFPKITTIIHSINRRKAQVAIGDEEHVLVGTGHIHEKIGDRLFQISANSFFQTNTKAAERLCDHIVRLADFQGDETIYDLYSGAGTISLYVADLVERVIGFEVVEDAVEDARINCDLNGVENCLFVAGDLKDSLENSKGQQWAISNPPTILIDPPRAGMHPKVVRQVVRLRPSKIVYVSCNPATFARDAKAICEQDYRLATVQPVDMFPHTPHIELVSLFEKRTR